MTFQPAPLDLADRLLDVLSKPIKDTLNGRDIADGLLITLRGIYPCITEDSLKLSKRLIEAIEPYCRLYPEIADERSFLQAAIARNRLEFEEMKTYASSIIGARSDLLIKKSILLAELGEFESSEKIFARAYDLLARDYRDDRSSLYISDRAAWASILAKGISYNPVSKRKFQEIEYGSDNNCDPERHLQHLRDRIQTEYEADVKQNRVDPLFKPGSYRKGSDGKRLSNEPLPNRMLYSINNIAGVPLHWGHVSFLTKDAERLCDLVDVPWRERFLLALCSATKSSSPAIKKVLSRLEIARLNREDVEWAQNGLVQSINFWVAKASSQTSKDRMYSHARLGCFVEALGRLSIRASSNTAEDYFKKAIELATNNGISRIELAAPLNTLATNAWESIHPECRVCLLPVALNLPLASEIHPNSLVLPDWPDTIFPEHAGRPDDDAIDNRVDELIDHVGKSDDLTRCALIRLFPLARAKLLAAAEVGKLRALLFKGLGPGQVPPTGLLSSALFTFFGSDPHWLPETLSDSLFGS